MKFALKPICFSFYSKREQIEKNGEFYIWPVFMFGRLIGEDYNNFNLKNTVGVNYIEKNFPLQLLEKEETIKVKFWDTAGIYYFKCLTES